MNLFKRSSISKREACDWALPGLLAGWLVAGQVFAQTPSIRFTPLSLEDGLSQATVSAIVQDGHYTSSYTVQTCQL